MDTGPSLPAGFFSEVYLKTNIGGICSLAPFFFPSLQIKAILP